MQSFMYRSEGNKHHLSLKLHFLMWSMRQKLWWFLSGTELPQGTWWDMPLNNIRWELDCSDLRKESRRWQKQKDHLSFQGCLKITRYPWTLSQSVVCLQGILALTYFPWNQNIIVVISLLESRNVCELFSERYKQVSLEVSDIGIGMLLQIISKYPFEQKFNWWKSGISRYFWHRGIWTRKHIIYPDIKKRQL